MELEQQVVSLDFAKRLKELGMKQRSVWYWRIAAENEPILTYIEWHYLIQYENYSAFSVAELGQLLPRTVSLPTLTPEEGLNPYEFEGHHSPDGDYVVGYGRDLKQRADTEANARAKMLVYLLENKLLALAPT